MIRVKEKTPLANAIQLDTSSEENIRSIIALLNVENRIIQESTSVERYIRSQRNAMSLYIYIPALKERTYINNGDYIIKEDDTNLVWAVSPEDFNRMYEIVE